VTLRVSLDEIRVRAAERKRQREARAAALRARGVPSVPLRQDVARNPSGLARLLPWRRRED
jgi:hypothetical protein